MEIGTRYQPFADTQMQAGGGGRGQGVAPQEAIRTLSLRVPQTQSVPGIAPLPLLNASGGGGTDLDMLLEALMRAFSQGGRGRPLGGGAGFQAGPTSGGAPSPRIVPGLDDVSPSPLQPAPSPPAWGPPPDWAGGGQDALGPTNPTGRDPRGNGGIIGGVLKGRPYSDFPLKTDGITPLF